MLLFFVVKVDGSPNSWIHDMIILMKPLPKPANYLALTKMERASEGFDRRTKVRIAHLRLPHPILPTSRPVDTKRMLIRCVIVILRFRYPERERVGVIFIILLIVTLYVDRVGSFWIPCRSPTNQSLRKPALFPRSFCRRVVFRTGFRPIYAPYWA